MGNLKNDNQNESPLTERVRLIFEKEERARLTLVEAELRKSDELEPQFPESLGTPERRALVVTAKELVRIRRIRTKSFPNDMFGEAAWDILLALYIAAEDDAITVTAACAASAVPATTALRWIAWLEQSRLIQRRHNALDARMRILTLTDFGSIKMDQYLQAVLRN